MQTINEDPRRRIQHSDPNSLIEGDKTDEKKTTGKTKSPRKSILKNQQNAFAEQFFEKFKIRLH